VLKEQDRARDFSITTDEGKHKQLAAKFVGVLQVSLNLWSRSLTDQLMAHSEAIENICSVC